MLRKYRFFLIPFSRTNACTHTQIATISYSLMHRLWNNFKKTRKKMNSLIKSVFNAWRNNLFMKINKWFIPLQSSSSHWEQRYPVIILGWLLSSALTEMMLFTLDWLQVFWSPLRSIILGRFNDWYVVGVIFNHAMTKFEVIQANLFCSAQEMIWNEKQLWIFLSTYFYA